MKDTILVAAVVLAFAFLVTAHLAIVVGLVARTPRWRALAALVFPPLALYWGWQQRMRVRSVLWIVGLVVYVVALVLSSI